MQKKDFYSIWCCTLYFKKLNKKAKHKIDASFVFQSNTLKASKD